MSQSMRNISVLDCHIHYAHPDLMPGLIQILDDKKVGKFNIVCTPHRARLSLVPDALHLKAHYPDRTYVFGGQDISPYFTDRENCGRHFAAYLDTLFEMGCDGIKMLEGKPNIRKMLMVPPFDSPPYEPYWKKLEGKGITVLFHVNDPEEFWDTRLTPDWAKEQGWFYGDGSFVNNEAQYTEILHVLERHPGIKVIFAHFFFLSAQLDRLAGYLDRFPNMHVDLTPGIEMYHHFAKDPEKARNFFLKYQDRILYGTDIGAKALLAAPREGIDPVESGIRVDLVRQFLEVEGEFGIDSARVSLFGKFGGKFLGIGLPEEALEKIYSKNFERLTGSKPRALNREAIIAECKRLEQVIPILDASQTGEKGDASMAARVRSYFEVHV